MVLINIYAIIMIIFSIDFNFFLIFLYYFSIKAVYFMFEMLV